MEEYDAKGTAGVCVMQNLPAEDKNLIEKEAQRESKGNYTPHTREE